MQDTIAAIATPPGTGGVGILRLSGPEALAILHRLCPALPSDLPSHRLRRARVEHPAQPGVMLDDALVVCMRGPRSYTGEDVVEIQGHGGVANMAQLLRAACDAGARVAAPGEFTQRAYLRGRLDLTQAEAVADLIHASSEAALRLARSHLEGALGAAIHQLQEELVVAVTLTEAAIDFSTEEHVYQLDTTDLLRRIDAVQARIRALLGTWDAGRQAREGVRVVILGRPNAGKSTLFNLLCGQERAIVTDLPGTTRDVLEEVVLLRGVALRLADTAGIREATDQVERIGIQRALAEARRADLILWVLDGSDPDALEGDLLDQLRALDADVMPLLNKADLGCAVDLEALAAFAPPLALSLTQAAGQEALLEALAARALARTATDGEGAVLTRQRHREALERALGALDQARESAADVMSHEFIALDLRIALEATGEVVGKVGVEMILNRIFSEFCVGK